MLVKDWMTPAPLTVAQDKPVLEALRLLREHKFRRLPVVDGAKLVGIVTDKDLKDAMPSKATTLSVWEMNYLLSKLTVKEVMAHPVRTTTSDDTLENAALEMQAHKVAGLPVLDNAGALVGILTITDVLGALIQVLGLKEGGVRLTIDLPDVPGALEKTTEAIKPSNIASLATAGLADGRRQVVLRATGEGAETAAERLRSSGINVLDAQ
jgi:acetoin utilization protein AcuB